MRKVLLSLCVVATAASAQTWTLANTRTERTVSFTAGLGLETSRLSSLDTRSDLISGKASRPAFAAEFSLDCEGKTVSGSDKDLQLVAGKLQVLPGGKALTVTLRRPDLSLLIDVVCRIFDGQPAPRKWVILHNTGSKPMRISHLKVESLAPSIGPASEMIQNAQYGGTPRELLYTGRSEDAALLLSNSRTGDGFAILNEIPGCRKRTEVDRYYQPGFFPLGDWKQPTAEGWDGFARLATSGAELVAIFRNNLGIAAAFVQLPLIPEGKYDLRSAMTGQAFGTVSEADL